MLLVIDVGNTNTVLGVFDGEVLVDHWRIWTEKVKTADEWGIMFRDQFQFDQLNIGDFEGLIISSVVPPVLDMGEVTDQARIPPPPARGGARGGGLMS